MSVDRVVMKQGQVRHLRPFRRKTIGDLFFLQENKGQRFVCCAAGLQGKLLCDIKLKLFATCTDINMISDSPEKEIPILSGIVLVT